MRLRPGTVVTLIFVLALLLGCKAFEKLASNSAANSNANTKTTTNATNSSSNSTDASGQNDDGTIPSGTGVEKEKPAAGKGNVQGKAFYNEKPAAGVDVKLC